jgi:hypothetical protein
VRHFLQQPSQTGAANFEAIVRRRLLGHVDYV